MNEYETLSPSSILSGKFFQNSPISITVHLLVIQHFLSSRTNISLGFTTIPRQNLYEGEIRFLFSPSFGSALRHW